eukprot:1356582-Pyramimonas_sp.AAC.1
MARVEYGSGLRFAVPRGSRVLGQLASGDSSLPHHRQCHHQAASHADAAIPARDLGSARGAGARLTPRVHRPDASGTGSAG